jgi:hypothetical protein
MTASEDRAWFIDAWAVHDGKVFASRRPPESTAADATVFMSVPDLEAVPVGRISTALRATRGGFQEGLRTNDSDLAEIPFDDLRQVRDLVRRGYLAADLGPGSPGAIAGPLPLPRPDAGPGAGGNIVGPESPGSPEPWAPINLSEAGPPPDLDRAVATVALATILEWDRHLASKEPGEIRGLMGWLGALSRAGITPDVARPSGARSSSLLLGLADQYGARNLHATLRLVDDTWWEPGFLPGFPLWFGDWGSGSWSRSHLAVVPLPVAPGWPAKVRRLTDMSLLPVIDRRFWMAPRQMTSLDVAPLVLSHAIRQPPRWGWLPHERSAAEAAYDRARASMAWLEIVLPPAAESVLEEFIDRCLAGPTTPTGSPAPSGPSAPSPAGASRRWEPPPQTLSASAG